MNNWCSAKTNIPMKEGRYLVCLSEESHTQYPYNILILNFTPQYNRFYKENFEKLTNVWYKHDSEWGDVDYTKRVKYWMEIPPMPEDVKKGAF